jgi:hypothetical protein
MPQLPLGGAIRFRALDDAEIIATLARLSDRIAERFPDSGLRRVSEELLDFARGTAGTIAYMRRPNWAIRAAVATVLALVLGALVVLATRLELPTAVGGLVTLVGLLESTINDLVFLGAAVFFLITVETRIKRRRALAALHQLRSVVHIVDMHQLTKDPERLMLPQPDTASSPRRTMTAPELGRYLDYCSELLSLTSKIAALFAQQFDDPVVLAAVNEIETLATGLSGKIWQKITLLDRAAIRG